MTSSDGTALGVLRLNGDHVVHNQIMEINENPLLLYLDTLRANKNEDVLPLKVYESRTQIVEGTPKNVFIELAFKVGAIEPERIAIDHVAKMTVPSQGSATWRTPLKLRKPSSH